jgi:hypothetical protein
MAEAPALKGVTGVKASPCIDGSHVNGVEPQPKNVPGQGALTPVSLRGPGFSPSREAASDDVMSVPGSFNIVDLGTGEVGLPGFPRAPLLPASWKQVVGVQS